MDFSLTEDQQMALETAREFAQKRLKPAAERFDEEETIPMEFYREAGELGLFGLMVPEEFGGLALDQVGYVCVMEEIARTCAAFQICLTVHNSLVCGALLKNGTDAQKKKYLPKLASGEWIGAYSLSEQGSGTDAGSLVCEAKRDGDFFVLNGTKAWVSSANIAQVFTVYVSTDREKKSHGISCLIVEKGTPGFEVGKKEKKMGVRGSETCELIFRGCRVPAENLIGAENMGFKVALGALDSGRIGIAAQSVGIAQGAFDEALAYAKERRQFGKALSEFQATQFKLADMSTAIEAARLLTRRAAAKMTADGRATLEASRAKLFASTTANKVVFDAVQIHGGNGYVREFPVERYFRDARVTEIYEGTSEVQRLVIARALLKD
ncbi:MAG: acyl-CoA dehydrogenase [Elusimicrobia bacterium CG_4_10_14_0_2_um_filter_63_34]|nr:MAG: acyl-CoA dehydrogenase [Elusimicrobia bacterium CG_4_10_14_0_2_um_filter_63_34]